MNWVRCGHPAAMGESLSSLSVELPALPASVGKARGWALDALRQVAVDRQAVALVVTEAVTNAVLHGYRDRAGGQILLRATVTADDVVIEVADNGPGPR